jgi:hypothetical protein
MNTRSQIKGLLNIKTAPRLVGIATAGRPFCGGNGAVIFLDCHGCGTSITAKFESNQAVDGCTDDQAIALFAEQGWSIAPQRCPQCQEKERHHAR